MVESTVQPRPFQIHSVMDGIARILHRTDIRSEDRVDESTGESTTLWCYDENEYRIPVRYNSVSEMQQAVRGNPAARAKIAHMLEKMGADRTTATMGSEWVSDDDAPTVPHWARIESFSVGTKKPLNVIRSWKGHTIRLACYVTQDIVEAFQSDRLSVGDYVIVEFMDGSLDSPVAVQKIFKSW